MFLSSHIPLFTKAAAGDRHLAEFCPGKWYLESPERVEEMGFHLATVTWRKEDLAERLAKAEKLISGEEDAKFTETGEDGVRQIRALLGLHTFVTNVNQLVTKIILEQMALLEAINNRNLEDIFFIFCSDPNVACSMNEARELFGQMIENTKKYLTDYDLTEFCVK